MIEKVKLKDRSFSIYAIRTDRETYGTLAELAAESGLSIAEIVRQCVSFAVERLVWAEEAPR